MSNPQLEPAAAWPAASTVPSSSERFAALFADPSDRGAGAGPRGARPWLRRHRRVGIVLAVIVAVVVGAFATDAFGSGGNSYRVAVVTNHAVDTVLTAVATIEPVSQAKVAFPVSGKVASVDVKAGDQIAVGQTLAALDTQTLIQTLHSKELALAQAKLTLSKALSGQSVGSAGGSGNSGGGGASATLSSYRTGTGATGTDTSGRGAAGATAVLTAATSTSTDPQLAAAQQAVLTAQHNVDTALAAATAALDNATTVCAAGNDPAHLAACQTALGDVQTAQTAVDTAQHKLADASSALDDLLAQRAASPPTTPTTTPAGGRTSGSGSSTGGTGGTGSTGASGFGGSGSTKSTAPSSADLASDQAAVDAATAQVAVAYQSVLQATITSPIQGTVVAVNLAAGDSVTSASTTANVVVQGPGGYEVTTSVSVTKVPDVAVGQRATVVPDGGHTALAGKVTSISVAPTSSSSAATSYRVVVGLDDPNSKVGNGSTGTVSIVTKSAKAGLAVPSSAITTIGRRHVVNVVQGGTTQTVVVGVGVVGSNWTEITSGLTRGQQVVLADLSSPLPNSATAANSTTTNNGLGGAGFTFPGGGIVRLPGGTGTGR